jgi:hypothetical protein
MYQNGGKATVEGSEVAPKLNSDTAGLTFGYMMNEQLQMQFRYQASLNPGDNDLSADAIELNFNYFF